MGTRNTADNRKAEIATAMLRLADELGPDSVDNCGGGRGSPPDPTGDFSHFPTKQDLWLAVAAQIATSMTEAWDEVLMANLPPQERVSALIMVQLRQIVANPAIPAILHSRELHARMQRCVASSSR